MPQPHKTIKRLKNFLPFSFELSFFRLSFWLRVVMLSSTRAMFRHHI